LCTGLPDLLLMESVPSMKGRIAFRVFDPIQEKVISSYENKLHCAEHYGLSTKQKKALKDTPAVVIQRYLHSIQSMLGLTKGPYKPHDEQNLMYQLENIKSAVSEIYLAERKRKEQEDEGVLGKRKR